MATDALGALDAHAATIARGAAEWRDPASQVRSEARTALAGGRWTAPVVEAALDDVLWDLDERAARRQCSVATACSVPSEARMDGPSEARVLVILPGNVIGPAIQSAYCAAVAGTHVILKAASDERALAQIVAHQFERLGAPLADSVEGRHWTGGDVAAEVAAMREVARVLVFGEDRTIARIRERAPVGVEVVGFGEAYSIGFVHAGAEIGAAATSAARDVCMFDQRGCMSPQTIYIQGDRGRATLFAHALARALELTGRTLPRAAYEPGEAALVAAALRRLSATAIESVPHGLDTLLRGPQRDGVPQFAVAVEAFGTPECAGFGRIVVVKPCPNAADVATQLRYFGRSLETIGLTVGVPDADRAALQRARPSRGCELGQMQRPPFGYRPSPIDFSVRPFADGAFKERAATDSAP